MRRSINAKMRVFWNPEDYEYVAISEIVIGLRGVGATVEKALLSFAINMQEKLEIIIEQRNNI